MDESVGGWRGDESAAGDATAAGSGSAGTDGRATTVDDLRAEVDRLATENERLRNAYASSRRSAYRRSAAGLAIIGLVAVAGGLALPDARTVLFVLGAIGLFGAVLTTYLTPERFVAAAVGRAIYGALADNEAALAAELGLAEEYHYVPTGPARGVRLFVPQAGTDGTPAPPALEATLVATDDAVGLALDPSGADLLREFETSLAGGLADSPAALSTQLAEALTDQFELVESARPDVDAADGRATVAVAGSAYGRVDRFDHPVASVVASGLARGLDRPVTLDVTDGGDEWLVTCRWEPAAGEAPAHATDATGGHATGDDG